MRTCVHVVHFGALAHCFLVFRAAQWHKIKIKIKNMSSQSILSTEIDFLDDSDEEKEAKKDFLLACVLVGKYLSEKKKGQHFTPEKD